MCNPNVIKERALKKFDKLLEEALHHYEGTNNVCSLRIIIPDDYFSAPEYKEIAHNEKEINLSPDKFIEYCEYRGITIPQSLLEKKQLIIQS